VKFPAHFRTPVSESQLALTLALSLVVLAAMLMALLWQSSIIAFQQDLIRSLWNWKYVG
jgi:hypothetical protein